MLTNMATFEALKQSLLDDQQRAHRFATRFILVRAVRDWQQLLVFLKERGADNIMYASRHCPNENAEPLCYKLLQDIENANGHTLVLPLGELLRLSATRQHYENLLLRLAAIENNLESADESKGRRIYVPLFCMDAVFHEVMAIGQNLAWKVPDQAAEAWVLDNESDAPCLLRVIDGKMRAPSQTVDAICFQEYLVAWEQSFLRDATLKTPYIASFRSSNMGCFDVQVYTSSYEILTQKYWELKEFTRAALEDAVWDALLDRLPVSDTLADALRHMLHLEAFHSMDILRGWQGVGYIERGILWLLLKLLSGQDRIGNPYLSEVMRLSKKPGDFLRHAEIALFDMAASPETELLEQRTARKEVLDKLNVTELSQETWVQWEGLPQEVQQNMLSYHTRREKCEGIKLLFQKQHFTFEQVRQREDIRKLFPQLVAYAAPMQGENEWITSYFAQYRLDKLRNQISPELEQMIHEWPEKRFEQKPRTDCLINAKDDAAAIHYWDCVSAEWQPMLKARIEEADPTLEAAGVLVRAVWPTVTSINRQNDQMQVMHFDEKPMDEIIHSSLEYPDYLLSEFDEIDKIAACAVKQMHRSSRVLLSSDHGSSRMAVLCRQMTIPTPAGATPKYFGRYADTATPCEGEGWIVANGCMVVTNYHRFSVPGNCGCENHGGATPEETLVPLLVVQKAVLRVVSYQETVRKVKGQPLSWQLTLNKPVTEANAIVEGRLLKGERITENNWQFDITLLDPDKQYVFVIQASEMGKPLAKVQEVQVQIQSGLTQRNMRI